MDSYRLLGVDVSACQIPDVIDEMTKWIANGGEGPSRYIAVTGMHGMSESIDDPTFREALNEAALVVPDGMPLVWLARRRGFPLERRVYGPELMETFCARTGGQYRHYFYGAGPGVAEDLAAKLSDRHGIGVAGWHTPPFRPLSVEENARVVGEINNACPDVLWVGLSTPKQERWMNANAGALRVPAIVGAGAAFDFLSGRKSMAPRWIQENGLEWAYRLATEPKRLWRRYLIQGPKFVAAVAREERGRTGDYR